MPTASNVWRQSSLLSLFTCPTASSSQWPVPLRKTTLTFTVRAVECARMARLPNTRIPLRAGVHVLVVEPDEAVSDPAREAGLLTSSEPVPASTGAWAALAVPLPLATQPDAPASKVQRTLLYSDSAGGLR